VRSVWHCSPSQHTKFTYLVRHDWFKSNRGALAGEPWFVRIQACILYFYATSIYNIGLRLRPVTSQEIRPPNLLFFGGNGSAFLDWMTEFQSWNASPSRSAFSSLFQSVLEAGFGKALGTQLMVLTSTIPKHEVALGLLQPETPLLRDNAVIDPPVGEAFSLERGANAERDATSTLSSDELRSKGIAALRFMRPFPEREI